MINHTTPYVVSAAKAGNRIPSIQSTCAARRRRPKKRGAILHKRQRLYFSLFCVYMGNRMSLFTKSSCFCKRIIVLFPPTLIVQNKSRSATRDPDLLRSLMRA